MALPIRAQRVLRSIRQALPSGVVLGRRSSGEGPCEFIPLDEALSAQLDAISNVQGSILFRNASDWVALAPGTDTYVLTAGGPGADPSWEVAGGGGAAWWFDPPIAADFATAVTEGGATNIAVTDDADVGLIIYADITSTDYAYMRMKTPPTAPYVLTAKVLVGNTVNSASPVVGLVARRSATSQRVVFGNRSNLGDLAVRRVTTTTFNNDYSSGPRPTASEPLWLQMRVASGGAMEGYWSPDGKTWHLRFQLTAAQALNAEPDQIGFAISKADSGNDSISVTVQHYTET